MHEKFLEAKENSVKIVLILKDGHEHWRSNQDSSFDNLQTVTQLES